MIDSVVRLRKTPFAFILGFHGVPFLALLTAPALPVVYLFGHVGYVVLLSLLILGSLVGLLGNRVVLLGDSIESGLRWFPKTVRRSEVVRAQEGKVGWNRGFLTGIVVVTKSGQLIPVVGSAPMTKRTREDWIAMINNWAKE